MESTHTVNRWEEFAELTVKTNDLDPMYSVIHGIYQQEWDAPWQGRFLMYFLCFYHAGDAATCADRTHELSEAAFWEYMVTAAMDPKTKRAAERRHFRGANAIRALAKLQSYGMSPEELIHNFWAPTYTQLYQRMTTEFAGTQIGPYFIWKIYDIQNVCLDRAISLSLDEAVKYMPQEPRDAAKFFFPEMDFKRAVATVTNRISFIDHPVRPGKCGLAEAETVLCMMKGFFKTRQHTIGDDIDDKFYQLDGHPELQILLPPRVNKGAFKVGEFVYG